MKFKEFLLGKNITQEALDAMDEAAKGALFAEYVEAVATTAKEAKEASDKNNDAEALKAAIKAELTAQYEGVYTPKEAKIKIDEAMDKIAEVVDKGGETVEHETIFGAVKAELLKQKDALEGLKTSRNASIKINLGSVVAKAVAAMTFGTHTTGRVGRVEREQGVVGILRRTPKLMDAVNTSPTLADTYTWIEKTGVEGGVTMVAEGAVKPQGDFDLVEYTQKPKKEALIITISKEMLDDIDDMARTVEEEIFELIRLFAESTILLGDGTGNNIAGVDANATPFAAGALANTIDDANIFDVIRVGYNQINLNEDDPTGVWMHPTDSTTMELTKDSQGRYVMPPFVAANGTQVKGLPVIVSTLIPQGELYIGNFNRFKVKIRENIELEMGYRGAADDWVKNFVSFLGEMRLFAFIPANHYGSIVKANITAAKAALETV